MGFNPFREDSYDVHRRVLMTKNVAEIRRSFISLFSDRDSRKSILMVEVATAERLVPEVFEVNDPSASPRPYETDRDRWTPYLLNMELTALGTNFSKERLVYCVDIFDHLKNK